MITWRSKYYFGLDKKNKKLVYANWTSEIKIDLLDLTQIGKISIHESTRLVGNGAAQRKDYDFISLKLNLNHRNKEFEIELYDAEKFSDLQGEGPIANKLQKIINQEFKNKLN